MEPIIFEYFKKNKKFSLEVKPLFSIVEKSIGLMFRKEPLPLLFVFEKERKLSIHSFFCKPFKAIWLDKDKNITKEIDIKNWRPHISGVGKYLLEIPLNSVKKRINN